MDIGQISEANRAANSGVRANEGLQALERDADVRKLQDEKEQKAQDAKSASGEDQGSARNGALPPGVGTQVDFEV